MVMVAIASISLLVGGIGIMNIMLASVLERTREIGVRRAVGARRTRHRPAVPHRDDAHHDHRRRCSGSCSACVLSQLVGYFAGWSTIVTLASIVLAFFVSVSVGLVFGVYPAVRAASLDPVYALHYE